VLLNVNFIPVMEYTNLRTFVGVNADEVECQLTKTNVKGHDITRWNGPIHTSYNTNEAGLRCYKAACHEIEI